MFGRWCMAVSRNWRYVDMEGICIDRERDIEI